MDEDLREERMLTNCEAMIMKTIWDSPEELSIKGLQERIKVKFGKDYSRTTVATFLLHLSDKGFVRTYKSGRNSLIRVLKTEQEYMKKVLDDQIQMWFDGRASEMVAALHENQQMTKKDAEEIRRLLDALDD